MKKPKIIVVGSSNADMVVKTDRIPAPGETVTGGQFMLALGGKGGNQAVAAARLGGDVVLISRIGADMFGDKALLGYEQEGINTQGIIRDTKNATGVALILVDETGENLISVASGANHFLSPDDVKKTEKEFANADVVVVQLETPLDTLAYAATLANKYNIPLILDPAPAPATPLAGSVLNAVMCIKPNENEAQRLTGIVVNDERSAQKSADVLIGQGVKNVIITLGTQGSLVVEKSGEGTLVPAEKVSAVDTTAAGDAYSGALAVAIGQGKSLVEAAVFATKVAAISVTRMGAQPSLPTIDEIIDLR